MEVGICDGSLEVGNLLGISVGTDVDGILLNVGNSVGVLVGFDVVGICDDILK